MIIHMAPVPFEHVFKVHTSWKISTILHQRFFSIRFQRVVVGHNVKQSMLLSKPFVNSCFHRGNRAEGYCLIRVPFQQHFMKEERKKDDYRDFCKIDNVFYNFWLCYRQREREGQTHVCGYTWHILVSPIVIQRQLKNKQILTEHNVK